MPKNKPVQKGVGKQQQRPGSEQVRSGMQIQRGEEGEQLQQPKYGEQLKHQQHGKSGKK